MEVVNSIILLLLSALIASHSAVAVTGVPLGISDAGIDCLANYFEEKAPGKIVEMDDGLKMHFIFKKGLDSALPTIVFEGGRGENSLEWNLVKKYIPKYSTFSYDRAGYGWSDESKKERTAENIAKELNQLLEKASIFGKVILVGHSAGGIYTRAFAKMYPQKVASLLLVDSASEHMFRDNDTTRQAYEQQMKYFGSLEYVAMAPSIILKNLFPLIDKSTFESLSVFGSDIQEQCVAKMVVPQFFRTMRREMEQFEGSFKQLDSTCPKETIVISAAKNDEAARKLQEQLFIECGNNTRPQIWATDSGHNIQREQPGIIAQEIIKALEISKYSKPDKSAL